MKIAVLAVGRMKAGAERDLAERYISRAAEAGRSLGFKINEVQELSESRARDGSQRMSEEAAALSTHLVDRGALITLDERGRNLSSVDLAHWLAEQRDRGTPTVTFVIGGADGLAPDLRGRADLALAFGAATWPHQLVRVMLFEQMYRAMTILAGHPYHRA